MSILIMLVFQYLILATPFYVLRKIKEYFIQEIIKEYDNRANIK